MDEEKINKIYDIIEGTEVTEDNEEIIENLKKDLEEGNFVEVLKNLKELNRLEKEKKERDSENVEETIEIEEEVETGKYPKKLSNAELEEEYIGMLLADPKYIVKYYILFDDCYFEDDALLNLYKSVLFTEGTKYASEKAKEGFNFAKESEESRNLKFELKENALENKYNMEKVYVELRKLFVLRKNYLAIPIKNIQDKVVEIRDYTLYDKMSIQEVEDAIVQVNDTEKFKRAVLNEGLTSFLEAGENNLRNGLALPFGILTSVFKGIRKGETMAFAMPSNAGKSRFTTNLAANVALVHKKKVLVISNEMSEEKMKLCLITTILNNKDIQKLHGHKLKITEGELLEFKFRADDKNEVEVDENGYIVRQKGENQKEFVKRLLKYSSDFRSIVEATEWANKEIKNSIHFINITDHTNEELKKVIMNYYYKEHIEYVFYDTLKTDTANIGVAEEIKRTATILSNLAQNFNMYICSTLQLAESNTLPVNLDVNDLAVSRTVKEVLDTLCLIKQINRDTLQNYEYSLNEVDTKFYDLKKYDDPDVRYYACVVDKNRAGAKPTLVFRLNLAYNVWEELGYLRLKQNIKNEK